MSPPPTKVRGKRYGSDFPVDVIKMAKCQVTPKCGSEKLPGAELSDSKMLAGFRPEKFRKGKLRGGADRKGAENRRSTLLIMWLRFKALLTS